MGESTSAIVERMGGIGVLLCPAEGPVLRGDRSALEVIGNVLGAGAAWAAVPAERLDPDFFRLRTGVAGEFVQKFAQYGVGLAVVGDVAAHVESSSALRDLVREANRGNGFWIVTDLDELRGRMSRRNPPADAAENAR
ncbi:DUF4180 domain-containing protein [Streptomyces aidingensis]|uniref:DUF4180 domain-containing protein n=1 Tax=Streptomyces aidingensis TaxID=910347 RepID=A0A1I1F7L3_9ACTN|nr:DUF4180 domain-containing protein [Streptomyces aidingensis]SFB94952.1 protein of unknown function [Streptomyces aidingensis]